MVRYEVRNPLSPPRPEKAVTRGMLGFYEKLGWLCQAKKNGTYSVIYVAPDKSVTALNRHLEEHRAWSPSDRFVRAFSGLSGTGWWVVCAELLHSKVPGIRDVHYVHDVLVADGEHLLGWTYAQRYHKLQGAFLKDVVSTEPTHWVLPDGIWLARNHRGGFTEFYDSMTDPEDEGVVLKNPMSQLSINPRINARGMVKCRVTTKNYSF